MRIGVTSILLCPYYKKNFLKDEYKLYFGRKIHEKVEEYLRKKGYETEVPVSIRVGSHEIAGKIDAVHHDKQWIVEIKPLKSVVKQHYWEAQLGIYTEIMRRSRVWYDPVFALYRVKQRKIYLYFAKPMIIDASIIYRQEEKIKEMLDLYEEKGELRIAPFSCRSCPLRKCSPDYLWIRDNGIYRLVGVI